jgi:hypothetical protein
VKATEGGSDDPNCVAVVGIVAGVGGTLAAGLFGPVITGRTQRSNLREDRLMDKRLTAFADLLETTRQFRDNAQHWSAIPLATLEEPKAERLRSITAQVRVVGSDKVVGAMDDVGLLMHEFLRELQPARNHHLRAREQGGESGDAIASRQTLGKVADQITTAVSKLEDAIRAEFRD